MKKYMNPMLQIVSIKKTDIVTASEDALNVYLNTDHSGDVFSAGRRFEDWDAGY